MKNGMEINNTMDIKTHLAVPSCVILSTTAPEAKWNLQMSTPILKQEAVKYINQEACLLPYSMYSSEPLQPTEYANICDTKYYLLDQRKKELPMNECPQSGCSINNKIVHEKKGFLTLIDKQEVKHENTDFVYDIEGKRPKELAIDNAGGNSIHYGILVTPQEVICKLCDRGIGHSVQQCVRMTDYVPDKSNPKHNLRVSVNNKVALRKERDRRYRDKHQERINQRRREKRLHRQSLQPPAAAVVSNGSVTKPFTQRKEISTKQREKDLLKRERDRKYRERHREEINRRRKESRQRKQYMQYIVTEPKTSTT